MAARAPVPSVSDFRKLAVKPAAFAEIPDDTIAETLSDVTDYAASFVGKHAKGKIKEWDGSFRRAIIAVACVDLMTHRGYNKGAGADVSIADRGKAAEAWLDKVAAGDVEPFYVDETTDADDAPIGGTSEKSDAWTV